MSHNHLVVVPSSSWNHSIPSWNHGQTAVPLPTTGDLPAPTTAVRLHHLQPYTNRTTEQEPKQLQLLQHHQQEWETRLPLLLQRIAYAASDDDRFHALHDLHLFLSLLPSSLLSSNNNNNKINDDMHPTNSKANTGSIIAHIALDHGTDRLLAWQLTSHLQNRPLFLQPFNSSSTTSASRRDILSFMLMCLELIWTQASRSRALISIVSLIDLLPWLTHMWQSLSRLTNNSNNSVNNNQNTTSSQDVHISHTTSDDTILLSIVSILIQWTKLGSKEPRIRDRLFSTNAGVLTSLLDDLYHNSWDSDDNHIPRTSNHDNNKALHRLSLCRLLKELTFRINTTEKEWLYSQFDNDKNILGRMCYEKQNREAISAVLWNFACTEQVGSKMIQTQSIWETIQYLWISSSSPSSTTTTASTTSSSSNSSSNHSTIAIRRNVTSTIGTMIAQQTTMATTMLLIQQQSPSSIVSTNTTRLLQEQAWLIPLLLGVIENHNEDVDLRRRCMRTVRCLSSCIWGRIFILKHVSSLCDLMNLLIEILRKDATSNAHCGVDTDDADTKIQVCYTISSLWPSSSTSSTMIINNHGRMGTNEAKSNDNNQLLLVGPYIEMALVQTIEDVQTRPKLVLAVIHTLISILQHSPWQRGSSCFSKAYYERILSSLQEEISQSNFHIGIASFLLELIENKSIRDVQSSMACTSVVEILTILFKAEGPQFDQSKQMAISITLGLMAENQSRKLFVQHDTLLTALVNICLMANGRVKEDAKQIILALVPEL